MKTIRRLIYREVLSAVVFVAAGFLALFFFFDFVDELPNGRLLEADSILELRVAPERLTNEIARFVDDCWKPQGRARNRAA